MIAFALRDGAVLCPEEAEKSNALPRISGFRDRADQLPGLSIPGPNLPWTAGPSPCEVRASGLLGQLGNLLLSRASAAQALPRLNPVCASPGP